MTGSPSALVAFLSENNELRLAIAHSWEPTIWICDGVTGEKLRAIPGPANAAGLIAKDDKLIIAEQARDTVRMLAAADGHEIWSTPVDANPQALASAGTGGIAVCGSLLTGRVELLDAQTGAPVSVPSSPLPTTAHRRRPHRAVRQVHHGWQS